MQKLFEKKGISIEEAWSSVARHEGSVQQLGFLTQEEKDEAKAQNILDYLVEHKMGFVFLQSTGQVISVEDCQEVLADNE